jgi:hypothetical protein
VVCGAEFSPGTKRLPSYLRQHELAIPMPILRSICYQKSNASAAAWEFAPKLATATLISADHNMGAAA